jgi:glycine cleavage system H protein
MGHPKHLRYATSHEWALSQGGTVTVGITSFAVDQLTDLVFVDLPRVGTSVRSGEAFGEVESVKAVAEINAPVSGQVVEVNAELPDHLDLLKEDPYGKGWMIKIRCSEPSEYDGLLDHRAYDRQVTSESH